VRGGQQRIVGAAVQPGHAASEQIDGQLAAHQIGAIDVGDLELAARRRHQAARDVDDAAVVEVDAGDRPVRARLLRLFLEAQRPPVRIELDDAVALRIGDVIGEQLGALRQVRRPIERAHDIVAVEDVVAEDQADRRVADEVGADEERLCDPGRVRLLAVRQPQADVAAVFEQPLDHRQVARCADDQDVADPGQHQRREWIVDRRLVVDRQQLLADRPRQRVEAGGGAASENDSLQCSMSDVGCWISNCLTSRIPSS
jgi:hypothetical protein